MKGERTMGKKGQQGKETKNNQQKSKDRWNETELKLAAGGATLVAAFILSQLTGISHEFFYGSLQRYVSGFLVMVLLYLISYIILYKRYRA